MAGMSTIDALTPRQQQILELVGAGKTNREIAAIVGISENTVEYHLVKRIFPLLGVRSRSAAADVYRTTWERATQRLRESVVPSPTSLATMNTAHVFIREKDMAIPSDVTIDLAGSAREALSGYAFAEAQLGPLGPKHSREYYTAAFASTPSLLVVACCAGAVCGCALSAIVDDHVLVGPVAVSEPLRLQGIGQAMLADLPQQLPQIRRSLQHNIRTKSSQLILFAKAA